MSPHPEVLAYLALAIKSILFQMTDFKIILHTLQCTWYFTVKALSDAIFMLIPEGK
jgi:hypothetical protein